MIEAITAFIALTLQTGESITHFRQGTVPRFAWFHARSACTRFRYSCVASHRSVQFSCLMVLSCHQCSAARRRGSAGAPMRLPVSLQSC
jgi:hypothetical protein